MALQNRFFKPSGAGYTSQFVPKVLPVDLMAKTLYGKQDQANQMAQAAIKLGEWSQEALGVHDIKYVKDIKDELERFATESMGEDRTSPEWQRKYMALTNRIKNDDNLKSVASAVATHQAYRENVAKLKASNPDQAEVLEADYMYLFNEYTKEGGLGFEGLGLGDANIVKGVNKFKDMLEFFSPLKDSGSDSVKFLGEGIAYKNGWTGITDKRVKEQAERQYNLFKDTRAGEQLRLEALRDMGLVETTYNQLDADARKKVDSQIDSFMRNEFLDVGRTVVHGTSSTNIDQAYNTRRAEDIEKEKEMGVVVPTNETAHQIQESAATRDTKIKALDQEIHNSNLALWKDKQRVKNGLPSAYTAENLRALEAKQAQAVRSRDLLKKEKNEDWQRMATAEKVNQQGKYDALISKENALLETMKNKLNPKDYAYLKGLLNSPFKVGSKEDVGGLAHSVIQDIITTNPGLKTFSKEQEKVLQQLLNLETKKVALSVQANDAVHQRWDAEYTKTHTKDSRVETAGTSTRTDAKSVMAAANTDVVHNFDVFNFYSSSGNQKFIPSDAVITKFNGSSVTNGNFKNAGEIAISGQITYTIAERNAEGEIIYNRDGSKKLKEVTTSVNAVPVGTRADFYKQEWAREQMNVANVKERQGYTDQAKLARASALALNNSSNYQNLRDFEDSQETVTPIRTVAYSPDGRQSKPVEFIVRKIGDVNAGGGYVVKYGNFSDEFSDINAVNAYIQKLTNSQPK